MVGIELKCNGCKKTYDKALFGGRECPYCGFTNIKNDSIKFTSYSVFKMGRTVWSVKGFEVDSKDKYRVYKNGNIYHLTHGNDFETCTEAEINIMLEYLVRG